MNIPYLDLSYTNVRLKSEIMEAISKMLDSGQTILGEEVRKFEASWASYVGCKYAVGVGNGLDAMVIGLKALGIGEGDEVIVPSNTYIATWLAVSAVGATIVPVEPDLETFNIDVSKIEDAITSKTRLILPVHLYGRPCAMDGIMSIAEKHALFVMEDNAQAQGANTALGKTAGVGHINATSFYPGKNLGALGDAGIITTNDEVLYERCLALRNYGSHQKYVNHVKGFNSRLDELQAAVLSVKLKYLDQWNDERKKIASLYLSKINGSFVNLTLPISDDENTWHVFPILVNDRDVVQEKLKKDGIGSLIHYPIPPHLQKAYQELRFKKGDFPLAENIAQNELSLPIYPGLSEHQVTFIAERLSYACHINKY